MTIVVYLPNWIGDVVMATPAFRALRERYGAAEMVAVGKPYVADVVAGSPWFDRFEPVEGVLATSRRLRATPPELAVLFPNSIRSGLIAWLGGAKRIVGYHRFGRGWMLKERLYPKRDSRGRRVPSPIIDDYNRLARAAGTDEPGHRMELFTTPRDEESADVVDRELGIRRESDVEVVCLNPGAAFGAAKHWPVPSFARLAQDLVDRRGSQVVVLCGPSERAMAKEIVRLAARPGVTSVADMPLSLGLTKALVKRSTALVSTDSGPRHFAAAFGRPVVAIFGPTHIAWTDTFYSREISIQKKVPCGPCQQRVCATDHRCMTELTPAEVFDALERVMRTPERIALPRAG